MHFARPILLLSLSAALLVASGCQSSQTSSDPTRSPVDAEASAATDGAAAGTDATSAPVGVAADVEAVSVSGASGAYSFSVTLRSPDTGCTQYADWWEVLDASGALLYRRILAHSHVDEQPFSRSGGPVPVAASDVVWVRGHMNTGGYGQAFSGTADGGFSAATPPAGFGASAETAPPQPSGCAF